MNQKLFIIIHSSDVLSSKIYDQLKSINSYHKSENFPQALTGMYVGYHRLITGGRNYQCRFDGEVGAHDNKQNKEGVSYNTISLGIAWGGDGDLELPSPSARAMLQKQIWAWQATYLIPDANVLYHHSHNTLKTCPGSLFTVDYLRGLLEHKSPEQIAKQYQIENLSEQVSLLQKVVNLFRWLLASKGG